MRVYVLFRESQAGLEVDAGDFTQPCEAELAPGMIQVAPTLFVPQSQITSVEYIEEVRVAA